MMRYNKTIELQTKNNTQTLVTDRFERWELSQVKGTNTPWTEWWKKQHPSELRIWQKDSFLKLFADAYSKMNWHNSIELYTVYQRGKGYNQDHDVVFATIPNADIALLATENHIWIQPCKFNNQTFDISNSIEGSILNPTTRNTLYTIEDSIVKLTKEIHS
tara:strand:+ start:785 stop:1267 length:483 start_codon:yes stop_codon:yes gene_type:complete